MNEKRIREVIEVEQRALNLVAHAGQEAEQIPVDAETQAAAIVEKARASAQDEAKRMLEHAQEDAEAAGIISKAQERMSRLSGLADKNLERAVEYVLARVLARA